MVRSLVLLLAGLYSLCVLHPLVAAEGNLMLCESETDPLVYQRKHEKSFNAERGLVTKEEVVVNFEGTRITCIKATSRWRDGTGGTASLKAGGLGSSSATVLLQGQFFRGYSFDVLVRGVPHASDQTTPTTRAPTTVALGLRIPQSCFCGDSCERNIFDDRIFVPSFNMD